MEYDQYGNPIAPQYPAPQYPMFQQPGPVNQFLSNPGMAMAGAAINNMAAMRRGQAPQQNPFAELAAARNRNEMLQQQRWNMVNGRQRILDLQAKRAQQQLDPFFEYEEFRRRYPEQAEGMTFEDFQRLGLKGVAAPSSQREWEFYSSLPPEQQKQFMDLKRSGYGYEGPAGSRYYRGAGGGVETLVTPDDAIAGEERLTRTTELAQAQAEQDAQFRTAAAGLPAMEGALADTIALRDAIRSGEYQKTGFFEGRFMRFNDEETAKLAAKQVMQTLKNLQITNLAPVTEKEIQLIEDLYASVLKNPAANVGALEAAIEMMQGKIAGINQMGQYFVNNGNTLRDFGISQRWRTAPPDEEIEIDGVD